MAEHTVIGTRLAKVDGPERVTGKAAFGADLSLPTMLWAKLVRSPYSHARIKKIDPRQGPGPARGQSRHLRRRSAAPGQGHDRPAGRRGQH